MGCSPWRLAESDTTEFTHTYAYTYNGKEDRQITESLCCKLETNTNCKLTVFQ